MDFERIALAAVQVDEGERQVVIVPDGRITSKIGEFLIDEEAARSIIAAFSAHEVDVPIDYHHQSLGGKWASPDGKAPAAGWITALSYEPGRGLVGTVRWTEAATAKIRAEEYGYLSPVLMIRMSDRRAVELDSAALTNRPAVPGMERLAASTDKETDVSDQNEDKKPQTQTTSDFGQAVRQMMNLDPEASNDQVVFAMSRMTELAKRNLATINSDFTQLLERFAAENKVHPEDEVQVEACMRMFNADREGFITFMEKQPSVPPIGRTVEVSEKTDKRHIVLQKAVQEFRGNERLQQETSLQAFANLRLREADMGAATHEELLTLGT